MSYARLVVGSLLLMVGAGCSEQPNAPAGRPQAPAFAVSDGAHGGNSHFYFKPPLVTSTAFTGVFTPSAAPTVEICLLDGNLECQSVVTTFGPGDINVSTVDEQYQVTWKTGEAQGIFFPNLYRIQVRAAGTVLGFRDVAPKDSPTEVPSNPETEAFYAFLNGSTIPIKFRIEEGVFCAALEFDDVNGECNEGNLQNGILVQTDDGTGISIPPQQTLSGFVAVIVEPCVDEFGDPAMLPTDLPLYGPCFHVRIEPPLAQALDSAATIFICEFLDVPHRVEELIRLHKSAALDGTEPVFALPNAPGLCPSELARREEGASWLSRLARGVGDRARAVFGPRQLYATAVMLDRGRGGLENVLSFFQFALPCKMEILEGNNQVAQAGTAVAVDPAVLVTDLDQGPCLGATVRFEATTGNGTVVPDNVLTGADGIGRVTSWTLGDVGLNQLRAFGRGIADPVTNGPRPTFDPFVSIQLPNPYDEEKVQLATGEVIFDAIACGDGFGPIVVDGVLDDAWVCAQVDVTFSANLSGGSGTPARLLIMNDGDNLYVAMTVLRSTADKVNVLTVEFDHNGNGIRDVGEDVLELVSDGTISTFRDLFASDKCVKSNAAACGEPDVGDGGTNDGAGAFRNDGTFSIYEMSHPLASGDALHDFIKSVGQQLGVVTYLRHGAGAQGKTEFPANRVPLVITVK